MNAWISLLDFRKIYRPNQKGVDKGGDRIRRGGTTDELIDAAEGVKKIKGAADHRAGSRRSGALISSVSRTSSGRFFRESSKSALIASIKEYVRGNQKGFFFFSFLDFLRGITKIKGPETWFPENLLEQSDSLEVLDGRPLLHARACVDMKALQFSRLKEIKGPRRYQQTLTFCI